jgi:hypothetical protein
MPERLARGGLRRHPLKLDNAVLALLVSILAGLGLVFWVILAWSGSSR